MTDEYEKQRRQDRIVATLYRLDPDKLAAVRRATSGTTRCPECDAVNPANQRRCCKCGANLYYDLPDEDDPKDQRDPDDSGEPALMEDSESKPNR